METIEIEGKTLHLAFPDEQKIPWIGDNQYIAQIHSAWLYETDADNRIHTSFNPKIIGRCGMGKSTLAYSAGKLFYPNTPSEVFVVHCSDTTSPDHLLIHQAELEGNIEYHASPLVTAMVKGGICILDECQFLPSESWAAISSLLEQRYITSEVVGLKVHAHNRFRVCFTQNYEEKNASFIRIPEYISVILKPVININHPSRKHELNVLKYFFPTVNPTLLQQMVDFLQSAHFEDRSYSIRDCINVIQCYESNSSSQKNTEIDWNRLYKAVRQILDNQAIYFLNEQLNETKDTDFLFKPDDIDLNEDSDEKFKDFYEDEEEFAEYISDDNDDEFTDIDDSFLFLDDESEENKKIGLNSSQKSDISNTNYIKNLRKKIRSNLKKKKGKRN
ncbi:MAG: AAA family ATPase [Candidatus Lokiarchaeota archaeon]|nr:AAA family ATPase [Candidatus Lokiarchaeota archaeon]